MKLFFMMSWRNMWRHRRRSVVVISSIAIGVFAMMLSMGVMNGFNVQMVENTIRTSLGHVAIHAKGFQDTMKLEYNFVPDERTYRAIKARKEIRSYTPRLKVQGMIRSSETSRGVLVVGIDPEREKTVSKMYEYTSRENGSRFLESESADEVLISKAMADVLNVMVGDKVVVMIQDTGNDIVGTGFMVTGIYQTPVDGFDKFMVFVGLKKLQEITGVGNAVSELNIITADKGIVDSVARHLAARIQDPSLEILTWKDMAPNLVSAIKLYDSMMFIFFMIIFVTVIFSVANTLIMAIMERFHEIGVMKCIGTSPSRIFIMIIFEALNLGAVGLLAGIAGGLAFVGALSFTGIDFSAFMESMRLWGSGSVIYPTLRLYDISMATVVVLFTTLTAALYPAVKAARIKPLEALHYV
jgi:putative ABC transport system permease protein